MLLKELADYNAGLLQTARFKDYCPNGVQVEGRPDVRRLATAVTASQAVIDEAVAWGADALLVHHGYFWRSEPAPLTGIKRQRIATLLRHDISLLAYHLPLDAHPELGNNTQLGHLLGLIEEGRFGEQDIGCVGVVSEEIDFAVLAARVELCLKRPPLLLGDPERRVRRVAWCSGGAQDYFESAIACGIDVYLTGEVSEPCYHLAAEHGVAFIAAGHHATERLGVQALGKHLAERFGLQHRFIDQQNPI